MVPTKEEPTGVTSGTQAFQRPRKIYKTDEA